ncbi:MAG: HAD family hydrolase [Burkholderiaceae bacterium]|nr:HAD family hydrolase [Burkholderiaceae bacterium]
MNLALFDLDHTLLPLDSDFEWGQFLCRLGAVDPEAFAARNKEFFAQYNAGTLDPVAYLEFALGNLAQFKRSELDAMHRRFMTEVIAPVLLPEARALLQKHHDAGDLVCIATATNRFVTAPIAQALGVEHLIAAEPELTPEGELTGHLVGIPTNGPGKLKHTHDWLARMGKTLASFPETWFYSDSHNDLPLLSAVTHPVATNPNAKLAEHARSQGWPIINIFNDHQ